MSPATRNPALLQRTWCLLHAATRSRDRDFLARSTPRLVIVLIHEPNMALR
jgi:hypothetical protein